MNASINVKHFFPSICFPSDSKLIIFVLFPGQKVFVSIFHPTKALPSVQLREVFLHNTCLIDCLTDLCCSSGLAYYKMLVATKLTKRLDGTDNCVPVRDDFNAILAAHKDLEKW